MTTLSTKAQVEAGKKIGIDVSEMTIAEARAAIRQGTQQPQSRRAGEKQRQAEETGFVPDRKIRRKVDGLEGVILRLSSERNGNLGVRLKKMSGTYTLINGRDDLLWELLVAEE